MNTRFLPSEEWHRLGPSGLGALLPYVEPQNVIVAVVEDNEEIVGSAALIQIAHVEGLWIKPEYRGNAGVVRRLVRQTLSVPRATGDRFVFGGALDGDERMTDICSSLGGEEIPVRFFAVPVGG